MGRYRCLTRTQLLNYNCSESEIYENQPVVDVLQDKPLKDYEAGDDQAVQVTPQRAYLKLVKGVRSYLFILFIIYFLSYQMCVILLLRFPLWLCLLC